MASRQRKPSAVVSWGGAIDDLAWKYPSNSLRYGSQLIVNESEEAILFKDGKALDTFTAGRHTIGSGNIPLLRKVLTGIFSGGTPLPVSVWFINKTARLEDVKWGTGSPIQVFDKTYQLPVNVGAYGSYGARIADSRSFIVQLVGNYPDYQVKRLTKTVEGYIARAFKDLVAESVEGGQSVMTLATQIEEYSEVAREKLEDQLGRFGIELIDFFLESIRVLEDSQFDALRNALADAAKVRIGAEAAGLSQRDYYQADRSLDIMQAAAENEGGSAGALMSGGLGAGLGLGAGVAAGQQLGQNLGGNPGGGAGSDDSSARMGKLDELRREGLLTDEEYQNKKREILGVACEDSPVERLRRLKDLLDQDLISAEEFESKKAEILGDL